MMLVLTIGWAATATPVASPPIEVLRRSIRVRVNDYGPYVVGRSLDPSLRAAQKIGIARQGVARLRVTPIKVPRDVAADRCIR